MQQICDGYNPKVRMGNWYEESYSVPQPSRNNPQKQSRQPEIDISYIDAHFKLRPLNRMARLPPWNTAGLVQAPQYKNLSTKTVTKQNFDIKTQQNYFNQWKPHLYNKANGSNTHSQTYIKINQFRKDYHIFDYKNANELLNERKTDIASFKSQISPNQHQNQKALMRTIYQRDISDKYQNIDKNSTIYTINNNQSNKQQKQLQKPVFRKIRSQITLANHTPIHNYK